MNKSLSNTVISVEKHRLKWCRIARSNAELEAPCGNYCFFFYSSWCSDKQNMNARKRHERSWDAEIYDAKQLDLSLSVQKLFSQTISGEQQIVHLGAVR